MRNKVLFDSEWSMSWNAANYIKKPSNAVLVNLEVRSMLWTFSFHRWLGPLYVIIPQFFFIILHRYIHRQFISYIISSDAGITH